MFHKSFSTITFYPFAWNFEKRLTHFRWALIVLWYYYLNFWIIFFFCLHLVFYYNFMNMNMNINGTKRWKWALKWKYRKTRTKYFIKVLGKFISKIIILGIIRIFSHTYTCQGRVFMCNICLFCIPMSMMICDYSNIYFPIKGSSPFFIPFPTSTRYLIFFSVWFLSLTTALFARL